MRGSGRTFAHGRCLSSTTGWMCRTRTACRSCSPSDMAPARLTDILDELTFERLHTALRADEWPASSSWPWSATRATQGHRFDRWYTVDAPAGMRSEELVKRLLAWEIVESARPDAPAIDPVVNAADDPRSPNQGYLNPAPEGIDAEFAWTVAGGAGAGQRFVDLEQGWTLDHEDLAAHGATLLFGTLVRTARGRTARACSARSAPSTTPWAAWGSCRRSTRRRRHVALGVAGQRGRMRSWLPCRRSTPATCCCWRCRP